MEDSKTLFCSSKFPSAREQISSEFVNNLCTCPKKKMFTSLEAVCFPLPPSTYLLISVCWFHKFCSKNPLHGSNIILDSVFQFLCLNCMSPYSFCCHKPICLSFPAAVTNIHKGLSTWNLATGNASSSIWHTTMQWLQAWPNMICINCIHECVSANNI